MSHGALKLGEQRKYVLSAAHIKVLRRLVARSLYPHENIEKTSISILQDIDTHFYPFLGDGRKI